MLSRANRLIRGDDLRRVFRGGKKLATPQLVGYHLIEQDQPMRFGFVVSKACGNAVKRNQLKRRLRSLVRGRMTQFPTGSQVVFRTLPGSAELSFSELEQVFEKAGGLK